jgi:hypothetical protein
VSAAASTASAPRIPWWLWPNVLSLDAPIVAVLWQAALAKVHHIAVMPALHITLFIAVWLIFIGDRVLDGFSVLDASRVSARHAFYQRNRWFHLLFVIPVGLVLLVLLALTAIPEGIMWRGVALAFVVALYLLHYAARGHRTVYLAGNILLCVLGWVVLAVLPVPMQWRLLYSIVLLAVLAHAVAGQPAPARRLFPKELLCGFLFAVGCTMSVHFLMGDGDGGLLPRDTMLLALLCALNCIAVSCYESETDRHADPNAITRTWPNIARVYPLLLVTLAGMTIVSLVTLMQKVPNSLLLYPAAILMSTVLLGVVHHLAKRIRPELAHVLADAAVVVPMALIVVAR